MSKSILPAFTIQGRFKTYMSSKQHGPQATGLTKLFFLETWGQLCLILVEPVKSGEDHRTPAMHA